MKIEKFIGQINITKELDEELLAKIGADCLKDFNDDFEARNEKDMRLKEAEKIARQVIEKKSFPFPNASNVKYPLITKAVIEFNARVSPLICSNGEAVKIKTFGGENELVTDEQGNFEVSQETGIFKTENETKNDRAKKVRDVMNWIISDVTDWEQEKDRLTLVYALSGFAATKNYFDYGTMLPKSELVLPTCLYWEKDRTFARAERVSQIIDMPVNALVENMRLGIFEDDEEVVAYHKEDNHVELVEMHTLLDLDDDGYKEPYIVVFTKDGGKVLRITARFDEKDIIYVNGKIAKIKPKEYFVFYEFIPCLDGLVYPIGLCDLLLFTNQSINSIINQLIDAGTLANTQGGFISGNIKIRGGQQAFVPGEFKYIDNAGLDISNAIVPLPTKEPSGSLFQLLGVLVDNGKELAMLTDVLTGDVNPAVQPTTVLAMIEQGLSGFKAILKRLHRSLKKELQLYYDMIFTHLDDLKSFYGETRFLQNVDQSDFSKDYMIVPVSDEYYSTSLEKAQRSQFYLQLAMSGNPFINVQEATERGLQTLGIDNYRDLIVQPQPPQPDPIAEVQVQLAMEQMKRMKVQNQIDLIKASLEKERTDSEVLNNANKTQSETVKRSAEAISALANAEQKQAGLNNPTYIRQAKLLSDMNNQQAKENVEYEQAIGNTQGLYPAGLGDFQNNGAGEGVFPVSGGQQGAETTGLPESV